MGSVALWLGPAATIDWPCSGASGDTLGGIAMPESHPEVTDATAKELYANAINCAFPGCGRPLYRVNDDGSRTLNSRIAHIHARQENGPRWDPEMSAQANRSGANLLLLCIEHADEVDQPQRVKLYPPNMLREWKRQQLDLYDSLRTGWQITQDEAEEVIRESTALEVSILAETLNLGGAGGQAPSAGGGGGAAIGHGAKGGAGGPGGSTASSLLLGALTLSSSRLGMARSGSLIREKDPGPGRDERNALSTGLAAADDGRRALPGVAGCGELLAEQSSSTVRAFAEAGAQCGMYRP